MKSFFALVACIIVAVQAGHLHQAHHQPIVYTTGVHGHHGGIGAYPYYAGGYSAYSAVPVYGGHVGHYGGIHGGHHGGIIVPSTYGAYPYGAGWAKK